MFCAESVEFSKQESFYEKKLLIQLSFDEIHLEIKFSVRLNAEPDFYKYR